MTVWYDRLAALHGAGRTVVMVTVVGTEGSVPREVGARMIVTSADATDTIGGGHLEHAATAAARAMLAAGTNRTDQAMLRRVPLGPSLGQCCGGVVTLLFERLAPAADGNAWLDLMRRSLDDGRPSVVATLLGDGSKLVVGDAEDAGTWGDPASAERVRTMARRLLAAGTPGPCLVSLETATAPGPLVVVLERVVPPDMSIVVFGAGHVARALVPMLAAVPCRLTWVDGRPDALPAAVPSGVTPIASDAPEDDVDVAPRGAYFLVMTHSHALDLRITERVLRRGDFAYLGLIGSSTKRARFERRLRQGGVPAPVLQRLRCPIGIDGIPGKHPGEIAVSVAAEILQVRAAAGAVTLPHAATRA